MTTRLFTFILIFSLFTILFSASAPVAEPVYGGYIQDYDAITTGSSSRIFISTLSANSMFYADVDHTLPSNPTFGTFQTVPDLDYDDDYGSNIRCFAADEGSGFVFVGSGTGDLLGADASSGSIYTVDSGMAEDVEVIDSFIFWIKFAGSDVELHYGEIYDSFSGSPGQVYATGQTTITSSGYSGEQRPEIMINPSNSLLYVFEDGTPPTIYESSDTSSTINNTTTFSTIPVTDLTTTGKEYFASGISPSGRIFVAGNVQLPSQDSYIGYSDDLGVNWTTFSIAVETGWGTRVTFADISPDYHVFYGRGVSDDNGSSTSWSHMSSTGTPVMDSPHCADPLNSDFVYLRTDWGLGYYDCNAASASEWNDGITAVQVSDFDMDETKEYAWVASKSGVWYVEDYTTSPNWITQPLWPGDDSTPYRSIDTSSTGDPVYAGSGAAVWKYDSSYGALTSANFVQAMDLNSLGLTPGIYASSIAIDDYYTTERIYVGIYDFEDHDETSEDRGNLYHVDYNGSIWSETAITGGDIPAYGIDVNDVAVVQEAGNTVLYVGVDYHDYLSYDIANGVYRCEDTSGTWTNTFDFIENGTLININASIEDLYVSDSDVIYACGTDEFGTDVRCYYKAVGDTYWTVISNTGLPSPGVGNAITYDEVNLDLYIAVNSSIYVRSYGSTSWTPFYDYPEGTEISFIYYDDLLVGTDFGLYGHEEEEAPLPVSLSSFTGYFQNDSAIIEWTTQSEIHNSGWNIYRSNTEDYNSSFNLNIELINGFGTTSEQHNYSFEDTNEFESGNTYYYWLESIEYSGNTELFGPIGISIEIEPDNPTPPTFIITGLQQNYPNPFNPETEIRFVLEESGNVELTIYNLKGQNIITLYNEYTYANENISVKWDGKNLQEKFVASGVYLYKLKTENSTYLRKMILIK